MTSHEILGLPPTATLDDIRAAYKRACMANHPDRGGSIEAFQVIQKAYEALLKKKCPECGGKGYVTKRQGILARTERCDRCNKK